MDTTKSRFFVASLLRMTGPRDQADLPRGVLRPHSGYCSVFALLFAERPLHMFAHQRRRVVAPGFERGDHTTRPRRVAQADGKIAQPALVADAQNRAAREARFEFVLGPGE